MSWGDILVPSNVQHIQAITHSKEGAFIRQAERRYVPPLLVLHLWWVYNFTLLGG